MGCGVTGRARVRRVSIFALPHENETDSADDAYEPRDNDDLCHSPHRVLRPETQRTPAALLAERSVVVSMSHRPTLRRQLATCVLGARRESNRENAPCRGGFPVGRVGCRCHTSRATGFRIGSRLKTGVARVNAEMGDGRLLTEVMQHLRLRFSRKKASMYGTEHNVHDLNW